MVCLGTVPDTQEGRKVLGRGCKFGWLGDTIRNDHGVPHTAPGAWTAERTPQTAPSSFPKSPLPLANPPATLVRMKALPGLPSLWPQDHTPEQRPGPRPLNDFPPPGPQASPSVGVLGAAGVLPASSGL